MAMHSTMGSRNTISLQGGAGAPGREERLGLTMLCSSSSVLHPRLQAAHAVHKRPLAKQKLSSERLPRES